MSADILRQAAALMRERAEASVDTDPGDWYAARHPSTPFGQWAGREDADHIASWHPAVALAVANWLDNEAAIGDDLMTQNGTTQQYAYVGPAMAVATAYLGDPR